MFVRARVGRCRGIIRGTPLAESSDGGGAANSQDFLSS